MNLLEATAADGKAKIGEYLVPVDPLASKKMEGNITVGVRPEAWRIVGNSQGGLPVRVTVVEDLGADAFVYGTSGVEGTPNNIIIRVSGRDSVHKGETIYVTTDPQQRARLRHRVRASASPTDADRRVGAESSPTAGSHLRRLGYFARSAVRRMAATKVSKRSGRQVVAHAVDEQQLGAGDRGGGGPAAGDVHHLVGEAVDHQRRDAHAAQPAAAVGLGEHGQHLAHHAAGLHPAVEGLRGPARTCSVVLRVRRGADQLPDRHAAGDVGLAPGPARSEQARAAARGAASRRCACRSST